MSTWTGNGLTMPDLRPDFKHLHWRVMPHSFGKEVASDWADKADDDPVFGLYKNCGLWTMEEAAILYNVAKTLDLGSSLDIGSHTGWTTAHIVKGMGGPCDAVDPMLRLVDFNLRMFANCSSALNLDKVTITAWSDTSSEFFPKDKLWYYSLICIDGDHEPGKPLEDAKNAAAHLAPTGVIMLHDGIGRPVREAVEWLMGNGFKARVFWTPHLVFCCWRGDFTPPEHRPDPALLHQMQPATRMPDFDWSKCV